MSVHTPTAPTVPRWSALGPIPGLAALREAILSIRRDRKPKWRFRFAPDLIVELQPWDEVYRTVPPDRRPESEALWARYYRGEITSATLRAEEAALMAAFTRLFRGDSVIGREDVTQFDKPIPPGAPYVRMPFHIAHLHGAAGWQLWPGRWQYAYGTAGREGAPSSQVVVPEAFGRLQEALSPDRFASCGPEIMFGYNCVCCGKALTDPASMARWVGPECWGTSSIRVPWLVELEAEASR